MWNAEYDVDLRRALNDIGARAHDRHCLRASMVHTKILFDCRLASQREHGRRRFTKAAGHQRLILIDRVGLIKIEDK